MSAFFKRQIASAGDVTQTNEQKVFVDTSSHYTLLG
jgi:hypothetical protein